MWVEASQWSLMARSPEHIVLGQPLAILRADPCPPRGLEDLERAYSLLQPHYARHLATAWPRHLLGKDGQKSCRLRTAADSLLSRGGLEEANNLYNQAVLWAPQDSPWEAPELAMALASRAVVSHLQADYMATLHNLLYAMPMVQMSSGLQFKLQERIKEARRGQEARQAGLAIQDFLSGLHKTILTAEQVVEVETIMGKAITKPDKDDIPHLTKSPKQEEHMPASLPSLIHPLEVEEGPVEGRYLVAAREVEEGEVVVEEEASVCRLLPMPGQVFRCCQCLEVARYPVPCPTCSAVTFCSRECRAGAAHHRWECSWAIHDLHLAGKEGEALASRHWWLAARLLTQRRVGWMLGLEQILEGRLRGAQWDGDQEDILDRDQGEILDEDQQSYSDIFSLVSHISPSITQEVGEDFSEEHTVLTVLLLYLLEGCGWLEGHACEGWSRVKEVVAGQLYLALAITRFNSHTVEQVVGSQRTSIGQAIHPTLALANHSCIPTLVREDRGRRVVVRAARGLARGEEATTDYAHSSREGGGRREWLRKRYWFLCKCQECGKQESEEF